MASSRLQQQLLLLLLLPAAASSSSTSFTVTVPECGHSDATSRAGSINQFWLSTAPAGQLINASQTTEANICFTEDGLEISLEAVERNVFSTAEECQAPVWEHGNALELFIAPVRGAWDIPAQYHEIDGAPSGAAWGSCIDAEAFCPGCANVTDVTCANDGEFTCTGGGLAEFTNGVVGNSVVSDDGWRFSLAVPWSIFADWAQPSTSGNSTLKMVPWPHWRLNLYRYNFFEGIEPDDYELDAWSPTHGPSFHDPRRFGYACLGPSGVCDRSVIIKTDDADAAALCNLNGSWSTLPEKIVHGFPEHIQFFQHPGEANFTLRTTDWGDVLSYGHVVDASHVDVFMVANPNGPPPITGSILRWTVSSTCDKMGSSWCRFPACPFKEPAHWPAWSPHPVPAPPAPAPAPPPPPHAPEKRVTCGGNYGWAVSAPACPPPQWEPAWALNLSTVTESAARTTGFYDPELASQWGVVTFDWADGAAIWQDRLPGHTGEEVLVEQCKRVKAMGTGTRCMVYRQNELAVQWQASSRSAMTQANADAGWFLQFKTRALCDGAAECADAAYHNKNGPGPIPPCKKPASRSEANCPYCCNFSSSNSTGAYNEPLGGPWRGSGPYNVTRFGNNTLGDGQLFWDFRRKDVQDYVAEKVFYGATTNAFVDGIFTDDPAGYGQEHPAIAAAVQLTPSEVAALQLGTQRAWLRALELLLPAKKYIIQAFRGPPPFPAPFNAASCSEWMRTQCAVPANESTLIYGVGGDVNMSVAAFLIVRGPFSLIGAPKSAIEGRNYSDPIFRAFRLDTGTPTGECVESSASVFQRRWSRGHATVDCAKGTATLDFGLLPRQQQRAIKTDDESIMVTDAAPSTGDHEEEDRVQQPLPPPPTN